MTTFKELLINGNQKRLVSSYNKRLFWIYLEVCSVLNNLVLSGRAYLSYVFRVIQWHLIKKKKIHLKLESEKKRY